MKYDLHVLGNVGDFFSKPDLEEYVLDVMSILFLQEGFLDTAVDLGEITEDEKHQAFNWNVNHLFTKDMLENNVEILVSPEEVEVESVQDYGIHFKIPIDVKIRNLLLNIKWK